MLKAIVHWPSTHSIEGLKDSLGNIKGFVLFEQPYDSNLVKVTVSLSGLKPNTIHGFHIHSGAFKNVNQLKKGCSALGGHFNPFKQEHGSIYNGETSPRHAGDLCNNITSSPSGTVNIDFFDSLISLHQQRENYIVGRSVVIHGVADDLGREGRIVRNSRGQRIFKTYNEMTQKQLHSWNYTKNDVKKLMKESKENGNAGSRIACGIIHSIQ